MFSNEDSAESVGPSLFQKGSWKNAEIDEAPKFTQSKKEDISEKGIDENVHWFANPLTETLNWPRKEIAPAPNGSGPKAFPPTPNVESLAQRSKEDISEKGIDENVHWFANPLTETLNWPRKEIAPALNGSGPKAFPPTPNVDALSQSNFDIDQWTESQESLYHYDQLIQGPEDLQMLQRSRTEGPFGQPIYDEDGDGIEDNMKLTSEELDKFYKPNRFFPTEYVYNTRHGGLPG